MVPFRMNKMIKQGRICWYECAKFTVRSHSQCKDSNYQNAQFEAYLLNSDPSFERKALVPIYQLITLSFAVLLFLVV